MYWWKKSKPGKNGKPVFILYGTDPNGKKKTKQWEGDASRYSETALKRVLDKAGLEFQKKVRAGEVLTKQEAKVKAEQEQAAFDKLLTVEKYANTVYIPQKAVNCSFNYMDAMERHFRLYIIPALGKMKMEDVKPVDITTMFLDMQRKGKKHGTVEEVYKFIKNMFNEAVKDDTISVNPMVKVPKPKRVKAERTRKNDNDKALSADEAGRLLKLLEDEKILWHRVYVNLLLDTACREGEALGLTWDKIDFDALTVRFDNNLQYDAKNGVYTTTIKNGKAGIVPIKQDMAKLLQELKQEQINNGVVTPWVFTQDVRGEAMHPDTPYNWLRRFGVRHGFQKGKDDILGNHKLRHTAISIMHQNGIDDATIALIARDNIETIQRVYMHSNDEKMKEALEQYHAVLEGKKSVADLVAVDEKKDKVIRLDKIQEDKAKKGS